MTKNNYPLTGRTLDRNETKQAREYKEQENELVPGLPHATSGVSVSCSSVLPKVAHLASPLGLLVQQPTRSEGAADCVSFWRRSSLQTTLS